MDFQLAQIARFPTPELWRAPTLALTCRWICRTTLQSPFVVRQSCWSTNSDETGFVEWTPWYNNDMYSGQLFPFPQCITSCKEFIHTCQTGQTVDWYTVKLQPPCVKSMFTLPGVCNQPQSLSSLDHGLWKHTVCGLRCSSLYLRCVMCFCCCQLLST